MLKNRYNASFALPQLVLRHKGLEGTLFLIIDALGCLRFISIALFFTSIRSTGPSGKVRGTIRPRPA